MIRQHVNNWIFLTALIKEIQNDNCKCESPGGIKPIDLECDNNAAVSITFRGNDAASLNTMPQPPLSRHHVTSLPPSNFSYAEQKKPDLKRHPGERSGVNHSLCLRYFFNGNCF